MAFHQELAEIFMALRDLHTSYRLPSPFSEKTAWLPFLIEEYYEHERPHYLVTKVVGRAGPESFCAAGGGVVLERDANRTRGRAQCGAPGG
jgi:hypothetical protein